MFEISRTLNAALLNNEVIFCHFFSGQHLFPSPPPSFFSPYVYEGFFFSFFFFLFFLFLFFFLLMEVKEYNSRFPFCSFLLVLLENLVCLFYLQFQPAAVS